jgi:catechol 2,3-dioxygenase-like lactoylglutathione lyase family enzyme
MLDHISFSVDNYKKSLEFYDATLSVLGVERLMNFETEEHNVAGYGLNGKPFFWIGEDAKPNTQEFVGKARGFHIAFQVSSIKVINAWYQKCLEFGAKGNGAPGPRKEYHSGYYAAFVIDPNGYRLEAVLHDYKEEVQ